jgi:hypothetical protein
MNTKIFNVLMEDAQIKRAVLIKFGFGNVNKKKVVEWIKKEFPFEYAEAKHNASLSKSNVVEFSSRESEMMSADERSAFLDDVMKKL